MTNTHKNTASIPSIHVLTEISIVETSQTSTIFKTMSEADKWLLVTVIKPIRIRLSIFDAIMIRILPQIFYMLESRIFLYFYSQQCQYQSLLFYIAR